MGASCPGVLILLPFPVRVWGMGVMATLGQDGGGIWRVSGWCWDTPKYATSHSTLGDTKKGLFPTPS